MKLTKYKLNLLRQWFNVVQDLNEPYLIKEDYELAEIIYNALDMRVPNSIKIKTNSNGQIKINELKTTCDNCGNHVKAKGFEEDETVICYVCNADFLVKDGKLVYVENTGERE